MRSPLTKGERQERLLELVGEDPLLTDERLAKEFGVSVQTIRLDRLELGIPEMRVRAQELVVKAQERLKSLGPAEVAGDLVDLTLGKSGISILETTQEMSFKKSGIVRGHHLFAQGNSLAVAVIDAEIALTGSARLQFHEPVYAGDRVVAKAQVIQVEENRSLVDVESRVGRRTVFTGRFVVFSLDGTAGDRAEEGRSL